MGFIQTQVALRNSSARIKRACSPASISKTKEVDVARAPHDGFAETSKGVNWALVVPAIPPVGRIPAFVWLLSDIVAGVTLAAY
jgi:hypothetical protein